MEDCDCPRPRPAQPQVSLFDRALLAAGERFRVEQGDAVQWLRGLPDASLDLVITDPAYESLEKHRAKGTTTRLKQSGASSNEWFEIFPNSRFPALFAELFRVLREDTHLYVLCDQATMFAIKPMGEAAGFTFWKPLVWDKQKIGMGYHYRARYEFVLFFEKGKRQVANLGVADVLPFKRIAKGYPTEKPVDLLKVLIEQSSLPGEIVADPFSGSGSAGAAALDLGRRFVGCDLKASAVELAQTRLGGITG
jgi:site-specific DNA-methyltransferase (adenine-specific)